MSKSLCLFLIIALSILPLSPNEGQIVSLINATRTERGLAKLGIDERLVELARERGSEIATLGHFSHIRPSGELVFAEIDRRGIEAPYAGECVARTNGTMEGLMGAFMASPSHAHVFLNPHYTHIGIGECQGKDGLTYIAIILRGDK